MKAKIPVLFIHGGMTFKNDRDYVSFLKGVDVSLEPKIRWHGPYLDKQLGSRFVVTRPLMPQATNALYRDWKIWFERYLSLLRTRPVLVGHSLGGIFLAKYLSENKLKHKARGVYLVAAPFDDSLSDEDLCGGFDLKKSLSLLEANTEHLSLFFAEDDVTVPVAHAKKYQKLLPKARVAIFKARGHFKTPTFPELVKQIKADAL